MEKERLLLEIKSLMFKAEYEIVQADLKKEVWKHYKMLHVTKQ